MKKDDYWLLEGELWNIRDTDARTLMQVPYARDVSLTPLRGTPTEIIRQLISLGVVAKLCSAT